ncbi:DUF5949 family protein [Streptomyces sp. NPDC101158]|uniref:DUF5949 family protein n=1 Tax=Streptomyces sp. NPDC101158 TaxID=3366117 RepID=UPI00382E58B7
MNDTTLPTKLGRIVTAAWIGRHPADGGDFPMLMAYSPGDGTLGGAATGAAMRDLLAAWGMRPGRLVENPEIHGTPLVAAVDGIDVRVTGFPGLEIARPTSAEWTAVARERRQVLLVVTARVWPDGPEAGPKETFAFIEDDRTLAAATTMLLPLA